jgi:hypothetical protein
MPAVDVLPECEDRLGARPLAYAGLASRAALTASACMVGATLVALAQLLDGSASEGDDPKRHGEGQRRGLHLPLGDVRPGRVPRGAGMDQHPGADRSEVRAVHLKAHVAPRHRDPRKAYEGEQRESDPCTPRERRQHDAEDERGQADERSGSDRHERDERHRILLITAVRLSGGVHRVAAFGRPMIWTRPPPISAASCSSGRRGAGAAK